MPLNVRVDWSLLRRAHQLVLLTTLAVIWGLAVTSMFMTNATSMRVTAAPVHDAKHFGQTHLSAFSSAGAPSMGAVLPAAPHSARLQGQPSTGLSQADRTTYAPAQRDALRQLSSEALDADSTPREGHTPSREPAGAPESLGVGDSATYAEEGEQEGER